MRPDYEAQFQRFYYDLYTLSHCIAFSEKAQEERKQIHKDKKDQEAAAKAGKKVRAAGPYAIDQIFRSFDLARRLSENGGAFFGAAGAFESRIKSATTPKELMMIIRELMLVMKTIQKDFKEEQQEKAARYLQQTAAALRNIAYDNYQVTDADFLEAQLEAEKKRSQRIPEQIL